MTINKAKNIYLTKKPIVNKIFEGRRLPVMSIALVLLSLIGSLLKAAHYHFETLKTNSDKNPQLYSVLTLPFKEGLLKVCPE